jgi:hypothetical protein
LIEEHFRRQALEDSLEGHSPRVEDSRHELYQHVSELGLPIDRIPQDMLARLNKIFSKHQAREVREWGHLLMKNYQLLHAVEKPINFDFVKPFASTTDLKNMIPDLDYEQAADRMEARMKADEKEEEEVSKTIDVDSEDSKNKSQTQEKSEKAKQEFQLNYTREASIGYLYKKMPYNYFVYKRIFSEIEKRLPKFQPKTMLDFGAGLGSSLWAAHHVFEDKVERVAAVEPNVNMRKLGKFLATD